MPRPSPQENVFFFLISVNLLHRNTGRRPFKSRTEKVSFNHQGRMLLKLKHVTITGMGKMKNWNKTRNSKNIVRNTSVNLGKVFRSLVPLEIP